MATPWWEQNGQPGWAAQAQGQPQPFNQAANDQANAWQNQMTPTMFAHGQRYGAMHPDWQGYRAEAAGFTPNQIMQGQSPDFAAQDAQAQGEQKNGLDALWSMLQGSAAPGNASIDLMKKQLLLDTKNTGALTGLKQKDLQQTTDIGLRRADAQIAAVGGDIANVGKNKGFVNQLYGQANKGDALNYGRQRDALLSDATARGAVNAHGTVGQFKNQYETFTNQLAGNLTQRNKSLSDLAQEQRHLETTAKMYGFDKEDLQNKLTNGMAQLGLQGQIDLGQLFKQSASLDAQKAANAQSVINTLIGYAGGNHELLKGLPGFGAPQQRTGSVPPQSVNMGGGRRVM